MPFSPVVRRNPAGRLLTISHAIKTAKGQGKAINCWAKALGCEPQVVDVYRGIGDLIDEWDEVRRWVASDSVDPDKRKYFEQHFSEIDRAIAPATIAGAADGYQDQIQDSWLAALQSMALDMPIEGVIDENELDQLRAVIEDLRQTIENTTELRPMVRLWLLDLVRLMREGLDRYTARGVRGLRESFRRLLGELLDHPDYCREVQKSKPSLWEKTAKSLTKLSAISSNYRTIIAALEDITTRVLKLTFGNDFE